LGAHDIQNFLKMFLKKTTCKSDFIIKNTPFTGWIVNNYGRKRLTCH